MSDFDHLTPVILIENSDCFTFSEDFLVAMELEDIAVESLIIFSSGNAILTKHGDFYHNLKKFITVQTTTWRVRDI